MVISITGHRPNKLGGYQDNPQQRLIKTVLNKSLGFLKESTNLKGVIVGMALGVDMWAAQECERLNIPFIAALPCENQSARWLPDSQREYRRLLNKAYKIQLVSKTYTPGCTQTRNIWMVERSHLVLGVWNGSQGGTSNCIEYAQSVHKPVAYYEPSIGLWNGAQPWAQQLSQSCNWL